MIIGDRARAGPTGRSGSKSELKANLRKRKDQARARADVKPDAQGLPEPARDKDDA